VTDLLIPSLPTLLSQAWVAWTIEVDNLVESVVPHRTTAGGSSAAGGPWLVSVAMYWTCLRHLDDDGTKLVELTARVGSETNLNGLRRWGYVTVDGAPAAREAIRPKPGLVVRPTAAGRRMRGAWLAALNEVDGRWRTRFGERAVDELVDALGAVDAGLDAALPDCLPILGYGLSTEELVAGVSSRRGTPDEPRLPILLARVLLAFALEVDSASEVPIAIGSNLVRALPEDGGGLAIRDLPGHSGVSKEAIAMAVGVATKRQWVAAGEATRSLQLTETGIAARDRWRSCVARTEAHWRDRHGDLAIDALRGALGTLVEPIDEPGAPIRAGLATPPGSWRSAEPPSRVLPHFPMVLHRGGWPDGA
jgi:hypothetical protein